MTNQELATRALAEYQEARRSTKAGDLVEAEKRWKEIDRLAAALGGRSAFVARRLSESAGRNPLDDFQKRKRQNRWVESTRGFCLSQCLAALPDGSVL